MDPILARRKLLGALTLCIVAPAAAAQASRKVSIAMLMSGRTDDSILAEHFISAMRELGWLEGQNVLYERYSLGGSRTQATEIARAVVKGSPDLIYAPTGGATTAALRATKDIPVVFVTVSDPVASAHIASLSRPGGNATGVVQMGAEVASKRLELVHETLPRARRVGVLLDTRAGDYGFQKREFKEAPKPKGLTLVTADITRFEDVPGAIGQLRKRGASVLTTMPSFTLAARRYEVIALASAQGMPVVSYRSEWAEAGALLSYGADQTEVHRLSAGIADRLLRGGRAAETPVVRASKFELIVNVRTAKKLGIEIPQPILLRADRVIQ